MPNEFFTFEQNPCEIAFDIASVLDLPNKKAFYFATDKKVISILMGALRKAWDEGYLTSETHQKNRSYNTSDMDDARGIVYHYMKNPIFNKISAIKELRDLKRNPSLGLREAKETIDAAMVEYGLRPFDSLSNYGHTL